MNQKKNSNGFIKQAGILAIAGVICRFIGILYRSPLAGIIKDEGNGYYSAAYNIYTIILLVASYSIPSAISKIIAQRLALKQYINAHRIFLCSLLYVIVIGGIASAFTFFGAGILVEENVVIVLRVFAPTIFFSGILGVLRGYFQAHGSMLQTSISQIVEQILNAVISIFAAYTLTNLYLNAATTTKAIYGAAGSAMGTGTGVLIALAFMGLVYMLNHRVIYKRMARDRTREIESYKSIFKTILFMVTPIILSTFIYNLNASLNQTIYTKILKMAGEASADIMTNYGIFAGKAVVIVNIPIAMASAMAAAMMPSVAASFAKRNIKETNEKVKSAIHTTMLLAIPAAIGMAALAEPIVRVLFPQQVSLQAASNVLRLLSFSVVFYALSTITNGVLQGIGKVNIPVRNAAISLVLQTAVLVPLLMFTELNLYALALVNIIYSFCMCILNGFSIKKELSYKQDMLQTFLKPTAAAVIMGAMSGGVFYGIYSIVKYIYVIKKDVSVPFEYGYSALALVIAVILGAIWYFVMMVLLRVIKQEEIRQMPRGARIEHILKACHIL